MPNTTQSKTTNPQFKSKSKSRVNKRQRNRRRNKQKSSQNHPNKDQSQNRTSFSRNAHLKGREIWSEAYVNAVRWHGEHQNNFWRYAAEQLQHENQMLRQQLENVVNNKPETQLNYETSDEETDETEKDMIKIKKETDYKCEKEEEDEVDSKYLEFMQVTIKHREELRLKREAADLLEEKNS